MTVVMPMRDAAIYSPEEVARRLKVSEETVRREIRAQHLGAQRIGKQYRIASSDLKTYLGESRFEEWFVRDHDLRDAIGSGNLPEDEAIALSERMTREVRALKPVPAQSGRVAPSVSDVKTHLKAMRQARAARD